MSSVSQPSAAFTKYASKIALIRAWQEGDDALKKPQYIRTPENWNQKEKDAFCAAAYVFNATKRTIDGFSGMVTLKSATIDLPPAFDDLKSDIDGTGTSIEGFINQVADELCGVGNIGILVDFPSVSRVVTEAQAKEQGLRPIASVYAIEALLDQKFIKIGGKTVLSQVRLKETYTEQLTDEFSETIKQQVRVLELVDGLYQQRVFREGNLFDTIEPLANGKRLTEIPFRLVTATGRIDAPCRPPLSDLAQANIDHLNDSAWEQRSVRFAGSPVYGVFGMQEPEGGMRIGDGNIIFCPESNGKIMVAAASAENIGAITAVKDSKRRDMAVIGARFLQEENSSNIAENTAVIHRSGDNATLSTISASIEQGLTQVLKWCGLFMGVNSDFSGVKLSRDYLPRRLSPQELLALISAVQGNNITIADLYDNLVKGEIIQEREGGYLEWKDELEAEAPIDTPVPIGAV